MAHTSQNSSLAITWTLFSIMLVWHHCVLIIMFGPQPYSLLLQPWGSVVRTEQWRDLLWHAGRWSSCHYGSVLCQRWSTSSWHGGHRHGCGQQPHHLQWQYLPDPWRKHGGKPQPHITLISLVLSYGEQHSYRCSSGPTKAWLHILWKCLFSAAIWPNYSF